MTNDSLNKVSEMNFAPFMRMDEDISSALDRLFSAFESTQELRGMVATLNDLLRPEVIERISKRQEVVSGLIREVGETNTVTQQMAIELRREGRKMAGTLRKMSQIIQSSSMVALNARIIAQSRTGKTQGDHMERLAEVISDISDTASEEVRGMTEVIESIRDSIEVMGITAEARASVMLRTLKPRAEAMGRALMVLEQGMEASSQASLWLNEFIANAEAEISQIISALQIGDRSRQRVEHIQVIVDIMSSHAPDSPEAKSLSVLALAQMQQTVSHAGTDSQLAREKMSALISRMPEFIGRCNSILDAFTDGVPNGPAPVPQVLLQEMEEMNETAQDAQMTLLSLDERLQQHSVSMSANASKMSLPYLKSETSRGANGVRVDREMSNVTQQIHEVVSKVPLTFDDFMVSMTETKAHLTMWNGMNERQSSWDLSDLKEGDDSFKETRQVLHSLLPVLSIQPDEIVRSLSSGTNVFLRLVDDIQNSAIEGSFDGEPYPFAEGPENPEFLEQVTKIRSVYTMQEERDLHDQILSKLPGIVTPEAPGAGDGDATSGSGDEMEDIFF